jgi:hypothetical protein
MIQTLSDKLLTLFETLKWDGKPFVDVYDYHTLENNWYPYMTFEPVGFDAIIADSCNNERTYNFQILIFQEITDTGWRQEAKEIIIKSISDIISLLDKNYTLDGTVTMAQPVWWIITPFVVANWKALVCEMTIAIRTIEFIW